MNDLMNEIKYNEYIKKMIALYSTFHKENAGVESNIFFMARKTLDANLEKLLDEYVDSLLLTIDDFSIEKVFVITDMLYNKDYDVFIKLLKKNNEKVMRAYTMMKEINGDNVLDIKNDLGKAKEKLKKGLVYREIDVKRREETFDREAKEYDLLSNYLNNINDKNVEKIIRDDLQNLFMNFHNIDKYLFDIPNKYYDNTLIIYYLFNQSGLDLNVLNGIFNEVLLKNDSLISFNYNSIIMFDDKFIRNIKGLFRKCNKDFFRQFSTQFITNKKCENINQMLEDIVKINSDDEIALGWFFIQFNMDASPKLKNYLKQFDYYNKYSNMDIKKMYDEVIDKLLKKDINGINPSIIENIGLYNGFINRYDTFLDLFCNSDDSKYQDMLLMPLTAGLIEKKRREYDLDFKIAFTKNYINNNRYGAYNFSSNVLFVNLYVLKQYSDKKEAFVESVNTIFHEIRHAKQSKEIEKRRSLKNDSVISSIDSVSHLILPIHRENKKQNINITFDNLLMAMDMAIFTLNPNYDNYNYQVASYEKDARKVAYNESMEFFKNRNDLKEYVYEEEEYRSYSNSLCSSIVRLNPDSHDYSTYRIGIVDLFIKYCNEKICMGKIGSLIDVFTRYPILSRFFTIRIHEGKVIPRSGKYFDKVLKEIEKNTDISKKKDALYAIKMFNYALQMQSYLRENHYIEPNSEELETKIGPKPTR